MPLYEYECEACRHRFEVIQKFSDPPVESCPTCGAGVHKLLSSPAIQFKGSGWYITDYARKGGGANGGGTDAAKTTGGDAPASTAPASSSSTATPSSTSSASGADK